VVRLSQQLDDQRFRFQAVSVAAAGGLFSRGHCQLAFNYENVFVGISDA
jgi:hypothetical protein